MEILLEAGMDPNCFDSDTGEQSLTKLNDNAQRLIFFFLGNMPLHEAVRYFR